MKLKYVLCLMMLAAAMPAATSAADNGEVEEKPGEFCGICEAKKNFHEIAPWLELGADARIRTIFDDNRGLDEHATGHDRFWHRWRVRVWAKVKPMDDLEFNIRLTTEPRYYSRPDSMVDQFIRHEALFDHLNVKLSNILGLPLSVTAGRQDIKLGNGWLVSEGTPLDGTRTIFFDALRLTAKLGEKTTADAIIIDNYPNSAKRIRPFNDRGLDLVEQDEQGAILYVSHRPDGDTRLDGYFIYKRDHERARASGVEGEIYTFGALLEGKFTENLKYSTELAPQFGHKNGKPLCAFGSTNKLTYLFNDALGNQVYVGYEYASGSRDSDQNFDKLWAREVKWSNIYTGPIDAIDGRTIDSSNLHRAAVGWLCEPVKDVEVQGAYHLLFADDSTSAAGAGALSRRGHFRGQLITAQVKQKISEHISHRVTAELFCPGNFYSDANNDPAVFARYEIVLSW